jgi:hypothetical protein
VAEREGLVTSPSLVSSAVEAMLPVLREEVVERPREAIADTVVSSLFDSAIMARVSNDSRCEFGGPIDLLYRPSL